MIVKGITVSLIAIFLFTSCATIAGTVTGPVTGIFSCTNAAIKEDAHAALLFLPFFPIVGVIGGFLHGLVYDAKSMYAERNSSAPDPFDPCSNKPVPVGW